MTSVVSSLTVLMFEHHSQLSLRYLHSQFLHHSSSEYPGDTERSWELGAQERFWLEGMAGDYGLGSESAVHCSHRQSDFNGLHPPASFASWHPLWFEIQEERGVWRNRKWGTDFILKGWYWQRLPSSTENMALSQSLVLAKFLPATFQTQGAASSWLFHPPYLVSYFF